MSGPSICASPSVIGSPFDPDSIPSFFSRMINLPDGEEGALSYLLSFEKEGPQMLANTVRSCLVGLVRVGIGHEEISAVAQEAVASSVLTS